MKKLFISLALVAGALTLGAGAANAQATEHCPDHTTADKTEVFKGFGPTITFEAGTEFCVKAGTQASGKLVSDGSPYTVTWLNQGGQTPDISYYVVYSVPPVTEPPVTEPPVTEPPVPEEPTVPETPEQPEVPVAPEAPEAPAPPAPEAAPQSLPTTGSENWIMAALAAALIAAGGGATWLSRRPRSI
jgi:LPXTG-motif cell wall-anchored protein